MPQVSLSSPVGDLTITEESGAIVSLAWGGKASGDKTSLLCRAAAQLREYFAGARRVFDLPLEPVGTGYQQRVWAALQAIPYGETRSYGAVAALAGGSARSTGQANAANPIPILIPCHRVVGAGGMGGYSGGQGLITKRFLLALEAGTSP